MWGGRRKDRGRYLVQITCVNFMITGFVLQAWVRVCGGVQSSDLESSFANAQAQFWQRGGEWCEVEIASLFKTPRHNRTLIYKTLYIQSTCDVPGTWNILLLTFFHSVRHEIQKLKKAGLESHSIQCYRAVCVSDYNHFSKWLLYLEKLNTL